MRYEIRLSGMGGQGLLLAGIIVAEAAMAQGLYVVQTASYGPESRGGASSSEVIISDSDIDYPAVIKADFLLAMTEEAAGKFLPAVNPDGIALLDSTWVKHPPESVVKEQLSYPLTETAIAKYEKGIFANIIGLGIMCKASGIIKPELLEKALLARVPKHYTEANTLALHLGLEIYESGAVVRHDGVKTTISD